MATTVTLADVLAGVEERAIALCFSYRMFQDLYCDPINVPIMRDCAPAFFSHLQSVPQDHIFVAIRALTETPSSRFPDQRFSLPHLYKLAKANQMTLPDDLTTRITKLCDDAKQVCEHVDARIVHTDVRSLSSSSTPLPEILVAHLEQLVRLAFELVNVGRAATSKCPLTLDQPIFNGDGRDLLRQLDASRRFSRLSLWTWGDDGRAATADELRDRIRSESK